MKKQTKQKENNIIELPVKKRISESEVNSLFYGLCKLIKRLALEDAELQFRRKLKSIEESLRGEIDNLQLINEGLKQELLKRQS